MLSRPFNDELKAQILRSHFVEHWRVGTGCPASLNSRGQTPCTIAVHPAKVITLSPESLTTLRRIR